MSPCSRRRPGRRRPAPYDRAVTVQTYPEAIAAVKKLVRPFAEEIYALPSGRPNRRSWGFSLIKRLP